LGFSLLSRVPPLDYFEYAGTLGTIPIILTYMLTNLALSVYVFRYYRANLDIVRHLFLPITGTVFMLFPLWGLLQPGQPWPFNVFPWIALGGLVLSAIYGILVAQSSAGLADRMGAYEADE
jgi:amino acid transporter